MGLQDGRKHSDKREIQRRCIAAKEIYCGLQSELDDYIATHTDGFTEEYRAKYERYQELLEMHEQQEAERESAQARYTQIQEITITLKRGALTEFDESVWNTVIENVTVNHNGSMMFRFRDGTEITE